MSGHPAHGRVSADDTKSVEMALRAEWWLNHGKNCRPYGDDGQMQCCALDFLRMPIAELHERVKQLRVKRLHDAVNEEISNHD